MSQTDWKQYFDRKAETHGASVKTSDYFDDASFFAQRDQTLRWLGELEGKTVLDAGCGVGAFSEPLTARNTVHGVDFSEKSLAFAATRGLHTRTGDLTALDFSAAMFDVVFCIGVIQLVDSHLAVVSELARITKPGGILLIQTLHKGSIQRKILGLWEQNKKFDRMYGMNELQTAFASNGFGEISFLKQYHPFRFVTQGAAGSLSDSLCTSFAVKGIKQGG